MPGQAKMELLFWSHREVCNMLNGHPVYGVTITIFRGINGKKDCIIFPNLLEYHLSLRVSVPPEESMITCSVPWSSSSGNSRPCLTISNLHCIIISSLWNQILLFSQLWEVSPPASFQSKTELLTMRFFVLCALTLTLTALNFNTTRGCRQVLEPSKYGFKTQKYY